jgi:hypothetical protein
MLNPVALLSLLIITAAWPQAGNPLPAAAVTIDAAAIKEPMEIG